MRPRSSAGPASRVEVMGAEIRPGRVRAEGELGDELVFRGAKEALSRAESFRRCRYAPAELRGFEPRTEPGEMALELRFLLFGASSAKHCSISARLPMAARTTAR